MLESKPKKGKGGRPPKQVNERATIKLNCWVTEQENQQLQAAYRIMKAGGKLTFAAYLKQILLTSKSSRIPKKEECLLMILINLQDRGRQLERILKILERQKESVEFSSQAQAVGEISGQLQTALTEITTWLYES